LYVTEETNTELLKRIKDLDKRLTTSGLVSERASSKRLWMPVRQARRSHTAGRLGGKVNAVGAFDGDSGGCWATQEPLIERVRVLEGGYTGLVSTFNGALQSLDVRGTNSESRIAALQLLAARTRADADFMLRNLTDVNSLLYRTANDSDT
jgi:hypothetical protein